MNAWLVVSTRLKNISQTGSFPQVGVNNGEHKKCLKPPARRLIANSKIGTSKRFPSAFEAQYFGALYMLRGQKKRKPQMETFPDKCIGAFLCFLPMVLDLQDKLETRTSWKKSCASWEVVYPIIYRVLYIPGGLPSTVCLFHGDSFGT